MPGAGDPALESSSLSFGYHFNHSLERVTLPSSLQNLRFGNSFNQSLERVTLPSSVQSLNFGENFNQGLERVTWPSSLQSLSCGYMVSQSLELVTLPLPSSLQSFGAFSGGRSSRWVRVLGHLGANDAACRAKIRARRDDMVAAQPVRAAAAFVLAEGSRNLPSQDCSQFHREAESKPELVRTAAPGDALCKPLGLQSSGRLWSHPNSPGATWLVSAPAAISMHQHAACLVQRDPEAERGNFLLNEVLLTAIAMPSASKMAVATAAVAGAAFVTPMTTQTAAPVRSHPAASSRGAVGKGQGTVAMAGAF
eukprot:s2051_g15.t1